MALHDERELNARFPLINSKSMSDETPRVLVGALILLVLGLLFFTFTDEPRATVNADTPAAPVTRHSAL